MRSLPRLFLYLALSVSACRPAEQPPAVETPAAAPQPDPDSPEARIADAASAAPAAIAAGATILDWPAEEGGAPQVLREGTNGWTCLASSPAARAASDKDPMCADAASMAFLQAFMTGEPPSITSVGLLYMLQGDAGASNTDPAATGPTADNAWVVSGPHVMIVVPDPAALDAVPTDPAQGGPFVMWKGTPYAHVMMPVGG